jgi:hypothetical protein
MCRRARVSKSLAFLGRRSIERYKSFVVVLLGVFLTTSFALYSARAEQVGGMQLRTRTSLPHTIQLNGATLHLVPPRSTMLERR